MRGNEKASRALRPDPRAGRAGADDSRGPAAARLSPAQNKGAARDAAQLAAIAGIAPGEAARLLDQASKVWTRQQAASDADAFWEERRAAHTSRPARGAQVAVALVLIPIAVVLAIPVALVLALASWIAFLVGLAGAAVAIARGRRGRP